MTEILNQSPVWLSDAVFKQSPFSIAVVNREFEVVQANDNFREYFGAWKNKKCYEVYKKKSIPCSECEAIKTFQDRQIHVKQEQGVDADGCPAFYTMHTAPLIDPDGRVSHVVEMTQKVGMM